MDGGCETKLSTDELESVEFGNQNAALMEIGLGNHGYVSFLLLLQIQPLVLPFIKFFV